MPGVIAILIFLLVLPVLVLMSGGVLAGVIGSVLGRNADEQAAAGGPGSAELLELED